MQALSTVLYVSGSTDNNAVVLTYSYVHQHFLAVEHVYEARLIRWLVLTPNRCRCTVIAARHLAC